MNNMSQYGRMRQTALYLLCWGEAAQVRFVPQCLCFIFKCADDYYRSPERQNRVQPVKEGLYLHTVIKSLYRFIRDQGYEVVDGGQGRTMQTLSATTMSTNCLATLMVSHGLC
jgi:1,3-beta-glucan synthase